MHDMTKFEYSYIPDTHFYEHENLFPKTGEQGDIYTDGRSTYIWSGGKYIRLGLLDSSCQDTKPETKSEPKFKKMTCPCCGGSDFSEWENNVYKCNYCGTTFKEYY